MIQKRLAALRSKMKERNVDAYLVPTDDFHCSEYVGEYFKCRRYITGFTGSAGTAVITMDDAGLWTDGRYFLQAGEQLKGTTITLQKMGEEGVPTIEQYVMDHLKSGQTIGFDGRTMTAKAGAELEKKLAEKGISVSCEMDLIGEIWTDRPCLSCEPVWSLDAAYVGKTREEKLSEIKKELEEKKADYFLLTSLDDIAWLLNIRGNDILCNPVVLSYFILTKEGGILFAQKEAFREELAGELADAGVRIQPYEQVYTYVKEIPQGRKVLMDPASVNYTLKKSIPEGVEILEEMNPTKLKKACKTSVEVENMRKAHEKDGAAVTRFIFWLKKNVGKTEITELSAAKKLEEFREQQEHYLGPSFTPIIGYGEHGAIVHYSATEETDASLEAHGLVLADTGGQYLEGTTDITRTIVLGEITRKEKEYFTRVLRGNLLLSSAKFPYGCSGLNLDYLARSPLWEIGEDYNHGTGHGVGYLLNVHEGPNRIHWKCSASGEYPAVFEEGMITSDEPGYYAEGEFGIRHENLIVCKKAEKKNGKQYMEFEPLTLVPFDLDAVIPEEMSDKERKLLNRYHKTVYEKISPYLDEEEREWLKTATREI